MPQTGSIAVNTSLDLLPQPQPVGVLAFKDVRPQPESTALGLVDDAQQRVAVAESESSDCKYCCGL